MIQDVFRTSLFCSWGLEFRDLGIRGQGLSFKDYDSGTQPLGSGFGDVWAVGSVR